MKTDIKSVDGGVAGEIELPAVFDEPYRPDLIKNAVLAIQSTRYQPHGVNPYAGIKTSAESWGSGRGVAQVPRINNGSRVARIPQAVGGRAAHPPKTEKNLVRKMNKQEKKKAIRSAIAATTKEELVIARGHKFEGKVPFVFDDSFESLEQTKDIVKALEQNGLYADVIRSRNSRNIRAGRGKLRGRRYKQSKSLLIVTGDAPLRAARNLAGVDAVSVEELNTEHLAPGTHAGRLTVWTVSAVKKLEELK
ncbi:large subunit ribosomal protein L4e [Methanomicrobium sp. W14]|uniref:50S ribosomal protein L4 n=1 Tax=Methanomicrobium sp. W14 TaxID=2817839 RepID=UPI001AE879B2|nr:50S ribosomal protein L4 [Methanomicrobium sp. W14]MBP2133170.1 large subunit ribosomal protein L4e [Methanomicrobium sp. W14]